MKCILCVWILLFGFLVPIHSEEPSLSFYVYTQDHQPMEGALFQMYLNGELYLRNIESDHQGLVEVTGMTSGTYSIIQTASISGYETDTQRRTFYYEEGEVMRLEEVINPQKKGKAVIQIVDEKGIPQVDYAFVLWDEQQQKKREYQSDAKGFCILENLVLQSYLVETQGQMARLNITDDNYDKNILVKIHTQKVMPFEKKKKDHSLWILCGSLCLCCMVALFYLYRQHDFDFLRSDKTKE